MNVWFFFTRVAGAKFNEKKREKIYLLDLVLAYAPAFLVQVAEMLMICVSYSVHLSMYSFILMFCLYLFNSHEYRFFSRSIERLSFK